MFGILPFNRKEIIILSLCWMHLMFYGCTIPGTEIPEVRFDFIIQFDKLIHTLFFIGFFLLWSCVRVSYSRSYGVFLIFIAFIYGLFIEYFQFNFVDGRGFEIADMLADGFGALLGFIIRPFLLNYYYKQD